MQILKKSPERLISVPGSQIPDPVRSSSAVQPLTVWAWIGAIFALVTVWMVWQWVTGPNFERVPVGPDQPPGWMKTVLMVGQIAVTALGAFNLYWFLVRPWRRQRQLTFDGLLCIGALVASFWDSVSGYIQTWFSYNSYLLNWGSPIVELPGVLTSHAPGAQIAWSFPFVPGMYVGVLPWFSIAVCTGMRAAQRRFPELTGFRLILAFYPAAILFDILLEGLVFMPLGFWSYGGGWWPVVGAGTYHQLPWNNVIHAAMFFVGFPAVRYFTNDRGETIVERGASRLAGQPLKQSGLRILAVIGVAQVIMFGVYHIPNAIWGGANSREWPDDIKKRSYLMNQCGPRIDRACPGPGVPIARPGSGYLDWEGNYVNPQRP